MAEGSAAVALRDGLGARDAHPLRRGGSPGRASPPGGRASCSPTASEIDAEAVVCTIPAGPLRSIEIAGLSDARLRRCARSARRSRPRSSSPTRSRSGRTPGQNGLAEIRVAVRLDLAAGPGRAVAAGPAGAARGVPGHAGGAFARAPCVDGLAALYGERGPVPARDARARVGRRPVHAGLHLELGARRPDPGRAAARHPRAAVLRGRLGSLGGRLHGGRGPDRPRGRPRGACAPARGPESTHPRARDRGPARSTRTSVRGRAGSRRPRSAS